MGLPTFKRNMTQSCVTSHIFQGKTPPGQGKQSLRAVSSDVLGLLFNQHFKMLLFDRYILSDVPLICLLMQSHVAP